MLPFSVRDVGCVVVTAKFGRYICHSTLFLPGKRRELNWDEVVARQTIGLSSDATEATSIAWRYRRKDRKIIGLRQCPRLSCDPTKRHCCDLIDLFTKHFFFRFAMIYLFYPKFIFFVTCEMKIIKTLLQIYY